jgi:tripartite-type tricarboxylate transporter receptor subunit TctC
VNKILKEPDVQARLVGLGLENSGGTPAQLAAFQKSEVAKWAKLIKTANIRLE